jgi:hypothetical protein
MFTIQYFTYVVEQVKDVAIKIQILSYLVHVLNLFFIFLHFFYRHS